MRDVLGIIADDLSGAGDTAVQFSSRGATCAVVLGTLELPNEVSVLAVESDSRSLSAEGAAAAAAESAGLARSLGATRFYKKIDSMVRGHSMAELEAVMDELGIEGALVTPAYPAMARITAGGYHLVHQVPVAESEAARDPISPVRESHLPRLFSQGCRRRVGHLDLSFFGRGADAVSEELARLRNEEGCQVIVCDATTEGHLAILAELLVQDSSLIGCGSAGLARALAARGQASRAESREAGDGFGPGPQYKSEAGEGKRAHPALVIAGSRSKVTQRQVEVFHESGALAIPADPERLLASGRDRYVEELADRASEGLASGRDTAVYLPADHPVQTGSASSAHLAEALGMVARRVLSTEVKVSGIVLTGGDVAKAACRQLAVQAIEIIEELYPAVPVGRLYQGLRPGLPVVTKAGGYGGPDILLLAAARFRAGSAAPAGR